MRKGNEQVYGRFCNFTVNRDRNHKRLRIGIVVIKVEKQLTPADILVGI